MKKTIKTSYAPPALEVLELKTQGIICQSGVSATRNDQYGTAIEDLWP